MTLLEALLAALRTAGHAHGGMQLAPAAVLWTDSERRWSKTVARLRPALPGLLTYGDYQPDLRQGPAIWIKCALAERQGELPIVYLPGVSRTDLRAIESCPRALQPLAELQYRGTFWSQANAKDWTVNAFLTSKAGGLGLDVAQDNATQEALRRADTDGVLWTQAVENLRLRPITATWLDTLIAPNPVRDVLAWMDDPSANRAAWAGPRWDLFASRCRKDLSFDPVTDGVLEATEQMSARNPAWTAVWEHYADAYSAFPNIVQALTQVQAPTVRGLFDDLSGYPQMNSDAETTLRDQLITAAAAPLSQARSAIRSAERQHGVRRGWLWARMKRAPLAKALEHLSALVEASAQVPAGSTPDAMASAYCDSAWRVDDSALRALAEVQSRPDVDAVSSALRAIYLPWLDDTARRFQALVQEQGTLNRSAPLPEVDAPGTCVIFVDGLRYDVGVALSECLRTIGTVQLQARWTCIPSVTASGKAWAAPIADAVAGSATAIDFEPVVAGDGKPLNSHHFRRLLAERGYQVLDSSNTGDSTGMAWVECGDLDHYGHQHGLRLARDVSSQLDQIVERVAELRQAGWTSFRIVTDHGWLLVPGGLPKADLPKHQAETRWGRCAVLKESASATSLTFGWDWCGQVQIAMAPGISCFIAGAEYAHGGLSLQESLVPVISVSVASDRPIVQVQIKSIVWRGLRCQVELAVQAAGMRLDIRTKAAVAETSVAAHIKPFEAGKASVAVGDDGLAGTAAIVVILAEDGSVLQKSATTIGE